MEHRFSPNKYYIALGSWEPVLHLQDGDTLITTTIDAMGVDAQNNTVSARGNPQTGPFFIEGADPGDTLRVSIDRLRPNRVRGYNSTVLQPNVVDPGYVKQLPESQSSNWQLDLEKMTATLLEPVTNLGQWVVKLRPMLGCFGVAPDRGQALSAGTSGPYGGNMDYNGFGEGAIAYFPVFVPGALFTLGDGHAQQGAGEILGSGIEMSMDVQVSFKLLKGKKSNWPRGENAEYIFTLGNARPLDQALQHATTEMLRWLQQDYGLDMRGANILLGQHVEYEVGNVIDPAFTIVCKLRKDLLPPFKG